MASLPSVKGAVCAIVTLARSGVDPEFRVSMAVLLRGHGGGSSVVGPRKVGGRDSAQDALRTQWRREYRLPGRRRRAAGPVVHCGVGPAPGPRLVGAREH